MGADESGPGSTPSIDYPILREIRDRLRTATSFEAADIVFTEG